MGMQWMVKDKHKSLEKIKYKFKLVYLLGIKIPLSLWFFYDWIQARGNDFHVNSGTHLGFCPGKIPFFHWTWVCLEEAPVVPVGSAKPSPTTLEDLSRRREQSAGQQKLWTSMLEHTRWRQYHQQIIRRIVRYQTIPKRAPSQLPFLLYANIDKRHNRTVPSPTGREMAVFDSNSYKIMVNSSACITNQALDFVGTPTPIQLRVKGIGGLLMVTAKGTIKWSFWGWPGEEAYFSDPWVILSSWIARQIVVSPTLEQGHREQHLGHQRDLAGHLWW